MKAPGPKGWPLLGHVPSYLSDKLGFLSRCVREYGDIVSLRIGGPTLLVADPEAIRHVLVSNGANYDKTPRLTSERGKRLSGSGLQTSFGAGHLRQRRLLALVFQRDFVAGFGPLIQEQVERLEGRWRQVGVVDVKAEMEWLALTVLLRALFGPAFADPGERLFAAITHRRAYIEYFYSSLLPFPECHPLPVVVRYRESMRVIDGIIAEQLQAGENGDPQWRAALQGLTYPEGERMTAAQVRDEVLALMSTGYETVGDALPWVLYLLARHPEVEAAVLAELRSDAAGQLPYLRCVIQEAFRLYPPTWIFVRVAVADDELPGGVQVPAGTKIYLCPWVTHRHPTYFPEPERFDPERFSAAGRRDRPRFAYFPFGGGARTCIGEPFAMVEIMTVLAALLPRYAFRLEPGYRLELRPNITLRPKGALPMLVERRG